MRIVIIALALFSTGCAKKGCYRITKQHKQFLKEQNALKDFKEWTSED